MRKLSRKLNRKLVPCWKRPWRYWSVIVLFVLGLFPDLYNLFAFSESYDTIPPPAKWAIQALVVAGYVARMWKQPKLRDD